MRKVLHLLAAGCVLCNAATASAITFKEKYPLDKGLNVQETLPANRASSVWQLPTRSDEGLVTDPQGTKSRYAMSVDIFLSNLGATHVGGFGAEVFISEADKTFASRAFTLNYFQQGYSVGDIEGDSVVFHSGQYIYDTYNKEKAYMYAAYLAEDESWPDLVDTFTLTKDEKGRYVSEPGYYFMVLTEEEAEGGINELTDIICFGTDYVFTPLPSDIAEDKMPADAEIFETQFLANSLSDNGEAVMKDVTVGVSGDKIYITGLCDYLPGCCLVGQKTADNTMTFKSHQYIGYYDEGDFPYIYEFSMANPTYATDEYLYFNEVDSITMTFNDDKTLLTIEEGAGIFNNAYGDLSSWNEVYWGIMLGDFNGVAIPQSPINVQCYGNYGAPYITFEWNNKSVDGMPMNANNLWFEIIINGEAYELTPGDYEGLEEATTRIYYNTSGVSGIYSGTYPTVYLYEYEDNFEDIISIGIKVGYQSGDEITYTDIVYANGYEPVENKAFTPSPAQKVVYYKDYYNNFRFEFDGNDIDGNPIPSRFLGVEILLDGEPLVFKNSDYYFNGSDGADVTVIGLSEYAPNYNASLVNKFGDTYLISLWGHDELPEFKTIAIRPVCTGGGTLTYADYTEFELERAATPANPWNVSFDADYMNRLTFGALPIDTNENGLAPWLYGYEVFVNGELFTFNGELYGLDNDITVIPYNGFPYNYDFYLYTDYVYDETDWTLIDKPVMMDVTMKGENLEINKIGVRAVYTDAEGNTTYSQIVNSDGTIDTTSGIETIGNDNGHTRWFNLQGIEVENPESGAIYLRQQNGKTTKVLVK